MRLYLALVFFLIIGCSATLRVDHGLFWIGDTEGAINEYAKLAEKGDKDFALFGNYYSTACLVVSNFYDALIGLEYSGKVMGSYEKTTSRDIWALVGSESAKVFKGDPYEKAMNCFYLGVIDYIRGDYDNALASFKNGLLMDAGSKEEKFREDFALLHLMKAKCLYRMDKKDEAENELTIAKESRLFQLNQWKNHLSEIKQTYEEIQAEAKDAELQVNKSQREYEEAPRNEDSKSNLEILKTQVKIKEERLKDAQNKAEKYRVLLEDLSEELNEIEKASSLEELYRRESKILDSIKGSLASNTLFILELGKGPIKVARGRYGEIAKFKDSLPDIAYAELYLDGKPVSKSLKVEDLYYQAITRGERKITGYLKTKGDIKIGLLTAGELMMAYGIETREKKTMGAGALLFLSSLLLDPQADIRCWETLPREIHIIWADIPEGIHTIELRYYDRNSVEISRYLQVYPFVPFRRNQDNIYLIRTCTVSGNVENLYLRNAVESWKRLLTMEISKKDSERDNNKVERLNELLDASRTRFLFNQDDQQKQRKLVKYCFDTIGHKPGTFPYIFGGTCCCTPTKELLERYHKDGFLLNYTLESLIAEYKRREIILRSTEHHMCNNYCKEGPHIVKGGKCMVPPEPLTRNFIEVSTGIWERDNVSKKRVRLFR